MKSLDELFSALTAATSIEHIEKILAAIGNEKKLPIDQPFGPLSLHWRVLNDDPSNYSTIGLASKPGRSLTERITNAQDAVLESYITAGVTPPDSPREAAKAWFGRPVSGPTDGLYRWKYGAGDWEDKIKVVLVAREAEELATLDVVDSGIGIEPDRFSKTILSLHGKNKISKKFLIGAFGQGGASTLAFCRYCVVFSRARSAPNQIGFTLIGIKWLPEEYKWDAYAYLAIRKSDGSITVPSVNIKPDAKWIPYAAPYDKVAALEHGTLVRHIAFSLPKLALALSPSQGNLYHYLHVSLLDPLLPFRVYDLREPKKINRQLITGTRNRLMKYVANAATTAAPGVEASDVEDDERNTTLRHHRKMEFVQPSDTSSPSIGIEYWVVLNHRKTTAGKYVLRPKSSVLFCDPSYPIIFSLNGQNQGELPASILRDHGLTMVSRHMIVHIDATNADSETKRDLFATTRENVKDGMVLKRLLHVLEKMIEEDEVLKALEKELTEALVEKDAEGTEDEVKKQVSALLVDAGLEIGEEIEVPASDSTVTSTTTKRRGGGGGGGGGGGSPDPLPTLPYPKVSHFEIVAPESPCEIEQGNSVLVKIETDADAEFDEREFVQIRSEPGLLGLVAKSPLSGGRMRFRLSPNDQAAIGDEGQIVASIMAPGGAQIESRVSFKIIAPADDGEKTQKIRVPPFEIKFIGPDDDAWPTVWPEHTEASQIEQVAYKPLKVSGKMIVYVSKVFPDYFAKIEDLKSSPEWRRKLFDLQYKIWIGYHAILQEQGAVDGAKIDLEDREIVREAERARVARMQVQQAIKHADLQHRALQVEAKST